MSAFEPHHLVGRLLSKDFDLSQFDCGDSDLNDFIRNDAFKYQEDASAITTCVFFGDRIIGFYSLATDALKLSFSERTHFLSLRRKRSLKSYPAIKIARMGFVKDCQGRHAGSTCIQAIKGLAFSINRDHRAACRFLTVDAYPAAKAFYERCGFQQHDKPNAKDTINMSLDLYA